MKKVLYIALAAALFLPVACNNSKHDPDPGTKVLNDPATKKEAKVIVYNTASGNVPVVELVEKGEKISRPLKKLEFTEASRAILTLGSAVKAEDELVVVYTYTVNGNTYTIPGIGTFTINGNNVVVTMGGETVTVTATVTQPTTSNTTAANLARTWTVKTIYVTVIGGNINVEKLFNGANLEEITKYVQDKGVKFTEAQLEAVKGYSVSELIFTGDNTFIIDFVDANPFYGKWTLNGNAFSYNLTYGENEFFNGSAKGTVSFPAASDEARLNIDATVSAGSDNYNGTLELVLQEKK